MIIPRIGYLLCLVLAILSFACAEVSTRASAEAPQQAGPIPSLYAGPDVFEKALNAEDPNVVALSEVTGLIVPHHLLAADLIARAIWSARDGSYTRVIIMSPDHFNRSHRPFATTTRDIDTVFGAASNDRTVTSALEVHPDLFEDSDLFAWEHGIAALLPFIRRIFPAADIVPIAIAVTSTREDWDRAFDLLKPFVGPGTLVIQSTDFSHYLTPEAARLRDQESLDVIAAGDPPAAQALIQPDHLDSKAALYIQMRLQAMLGSHPTVLANRNSAEYQPGARRTTSYVVAAYARDAGTAPVFPDQQALYFGGDFFAGRWLAGPLSRSEVAAAIVAQVEALTHGAPLVLNFEGTVASELPANTPQDLHAMDASLALPILRDLHVVALSLANNHSFDLGQAGLTQSARLLEAAGIRALREGAVADLGPVRVVALNYVGTGGGRPGYPVTGAAEIARLCRDPAKPPLLAFAHWGQEYTTGPTARERDEARTLETCGVTAVIGAHSHQASPGIETMDGGGIAFTYSLGNFLFDQHAPRGSGELLELRVFRQGTVALRTIPLPNFFDQATGLEGTVQAIPASSNGPARNR